MRLKILFYAFFLPALLCGGAAAAVTGYDFARYQVILDKKPFGEAAPSEGAQPAAAALAEVFTKELEMKAIVDDGTGLRIGLLDKKTNKNFSLGVGESHEGIQLVSVNYETEEAVIRKGSETTTVRLHPSKDQATAKFTAPAAGNSPFQVPAALMTSSADAMGRKPFFADLKRSKMTPFKPMGTNALPFQAKSLDSFFKVNTNAFPKTKSPFGPFQVSGADAQAGDLRQFMAAASNAPNPNAPNPFAPVNPQVPSAANNAAVDQFLQGQYPGQEQVQPDMNQYPVEYEMPVEEIAQ